MITTSSRFHADAALTWLLRLAGGAAVLVLGGIVAVLVIQSVPFLVEHGWALWGNDWQPGLGRYGMAAMVAGSVLVSMLALGIAGPVAVLLAAWLRYFAPTIRRPILILVELMAGIPSVVYGLWGMLVLVPWINQWAPPGASWLAASLVLALMILPLALLVTDTALGQLPGRYLQAGQALSLSRVGMLRRVLLPQAWPSIVSGLVLQFGRALGETMAVLMVAGNVVQWPASLFDPVRTLTANIALEMAYATGDHRIALFASGLLLLLVTAVLLILSWRVRGGEYEPG
ncbi:MAG: phosphate ABC transporter permease subunit PstC [Pseudomonadota bacterium]|nr:phosphate ABC transporter permease subunit PstC [Pseudomonadota bacterium]